MFVLESPRTFASRWNSRSFLYRTCHKTSLEIRVRNETRIATQSAEGRPTFTSRYARTNDSRASPDPTWATRGVRSNFSTCEEKDHFLDKTWRGTASLFQSRRETTRARDARGRDAIDQTQETTQASTIPTCCSAQTLASRPPSRAQAESGLFQDMYPFKEFAWRGGGQSSLARSLAKKKTSQRARLCERRGSRRTRDCDARVWRNERRPQRGAPAAGQRPCFPEKKAGQRPLGLVFSFLSLIFSFFLKLDFGRRHSRTQFAMWAVMAAPLLLGRDSGAANLPLRSRSISFERRERERGPLSFRSEWRGLAGKYILF